MTCGSTCAGIQGWLVPACDKCWRWPTTPVTVHCHVAARASSSSVGRPATHCWRLAQGWPLRPLCSLRQDRQFAWPSLPGLAGRVQEGSESRASGPAVCKGSELAITPSAFRRGACHQTGTLGQAKAWTFGPLLLACLHATGPVLALHWRYNGVKRCHRRTLELSHGLRKTSWHKCSRFCPYAPQVSALVSERQRVALPDLDTPFGETDQDRQMLSVLPGYCHQRSLALQAARLRSDIYAWYLRC